MLNLELSNILTNIAELYKFTPNKKDIVFPVTKASRTIRDYPGDIVDAYSSGELWKLAGIEGEAVPIIEEFFSTGKIKIYEQIKKSYPQELIRFIRLSGLGKKRMLDIYKRWNISSLQDLKEKIYNNDFIDRFTTEDKSPLKSIDIARLRLTFDFYETGQRLSPRGFIENFLPAVIKGIETIEGVRKVETVGSARRKKPLVGDIDILILPAFNRKGMEVEKSRRLLDEICKIKYINKKKSENIQNDSISYRFQTELLADMEVVLSTQETFWIHLLKTTGNKRHAAKVLNLLKANGGDEGSVGSEQEIYERAGLEYVPPELREDRGEIELAKAGRIPELVSLDDIKGDLHIHSSFSDGLIELDDIMKRVAAYGYQYFSLSDHSKSNVYGHGLDEKRLVQKLSHIKELSAKISGTRLLAGSEVDITDNGFLDYSDELLDRLDIVIASMHSNYRRDAEYNTKKAIGGLSNPHVDFLAHPTGKVFDSRAPYFINIEKVIEAAKKYNKALEINSYFLRLDLDEENARKAKDAGVKLVINTDSHRPNNLDHIRLGVDIARRSGLGRQDIINTLPYEEILEWKKQR